jgi:hypothetical protein
MLALPCVFQAFSCSPLRGPPRYLQCTPGEASRLPSLLHLCTKQGLLRPEIRWTGSSPQHSKHTSQSAKMPAPCHRWLSRAHPVSFNLLLLISLERRKKKSQNIRWQITPSFQSNAHTMQSHLEQALERGESPDPHWPARNPLAWSSNIGLDTQEACHSALWWPECPCKQPQPTGTAALQSWEDGQAHAWHTCSVLAHTSLLWPLSVSSETELLLPSWLYNSKTESRNSSIYTSVFDAGLFKIPKR